jgi:microcystin-dependent protein
VVVPSKQILENYVRYHTYLNKYWRDGSAGRNVFNHAKDRSLVPSHQIGGLRITCNFSCKELTPLHSQTYLHTEQTYTQTDRQTHTQTHRDTHIHTQTHIHTHTHTYTQRHTNRHTQTHTQTHRNTHTYIVKNYKINP